MPLKVLTLTDLFPTPWKPNHGIFIFQWAKHLAKKVELTVLQAVWMPPYEEMSPEIFDNFKSNFTSFANEFTWYQIPLPMPRFDRLWRRGLIFRAAADKFLHTRRSEYDVLIGQRGLPGGYVAVNLGRKYNKKSLVGLRGSDVTSYLYQPILKHFALWTYRQADAIVTVSHDLQLQLLDFKIPASKIRVVYNGINPLFRPLEQQAAREHLHIPEGKIILFVGNLIRLKAWPLLIEALKIIFSATEGHCYLIGDGEDQDLIAKTVEHENLKDRIHLVGNVPHSALLYWYNAADVLCLPSLREGIPNVMLEACACGRPVVASDISGNREVIREGVNGYLHRVGDSRSLAATLAKALDKEWDTASIRATVGDFTWTQNTEHYLEILKELLPDDINKP